MSLNASTASSSYSMSAGLSRAMMRQNAQSVTDPPGCPAIILAPLRRGALDGDVPEVQAQDPQEWQPREVGLDLVPQDLPRPSREGQDRLTRRRRSPARGLLTLREP